MPISTDEVTMNRITEKTHRVLRVMGEVRGLGPRKTQGRMGVGQVKTG